MRTGISAGIDPMGLAAAVINMSCKTIGKHQRIVDLAQAPVSNTSYYKKQIQRTENQIE